VCTELAEARARRAANGRADGTAERGSGDGEKDGRNLANDAPDFFDRLADLFEE
jgi:hypothetical protein